MDTASPAATAHPRRLPSLDVLCALAVGALALILYVATLQPDLGGPEDTPKFQFLGYVLGTAHPPGYPLYVMLSHVFVQLPVGTIAYRANLFSAVMASLAVALAYVITRQIGARRSAAFAAAAGLATGYSFWTSAVFAEVYSLAAVMAALTISLLLAWGARGGTTLLIASVAGVRLGVGQSPHDRRPPPRGRRLRVVARSPHRDRPRHGRSGGRDARVPVAVRLHRLAYLPGRAVPREQRHLPCANWSAS